jgi:hypothetical protein
MDTIGSSNMVRGLMGSEVQFLSNHATNAWRAIRTRLLPPRGLAEVPLDTANRVEVVSSSTSEGSLRYIVKYAPVHA